MRKMRQYVKYASIAYSHKTDIPDLSVVHDLQSWTLNLTLILTIVLTVATLCCSACNLCNLCSSNIMSCLNVNGHGTWLSWPFDSTGVTQSVGVLYRSTCQHNYVWMLHCSLQMHWTVLKRHKIRCLTPLFRFLLRKSSCYLHCPNVFSCSVSL